MFDALLSKIAGVLIAPIIALSSLIAPTPTPTTGTPLPQAVAVFETSLAAPITADATTLTLTANSIRGGGSLSGFNCFTIDEGSAQAEFVCGTVSTTTVSGLTRGISPADGVTEDEDLQFSHRRGANVKITDFPILQRLKLQNSGEGSFENVLSYAPGVVPTGNDHLTDVSYVLSVVNGGTVSFDRQIITGNAGETFATGTIVYLNGADNEWYKADSDLSYSFADTVIGIAQGAGTDTNSISGGILLSGKDASQTGLTAGARYFLSSTAGGLQTATSSQIVGIALSTTELLLDPSILDTYNGYSKTFAGTNTFNGTTTVNGTSTFAGPVTFSGIINGHASSTYTAYTASTTWAKPANLEYIEIWVCGGGNNGGGEGDGGAGAGACAYEVLDQAELAATSSVSLVVGGIGGTSSFGDFLSATGGGANSGGTGGSGGTATGGDLNIDGQRGGDGGQGTDDTGGAGGSCMFGFGGPSMGTGISGSSGGSNGSPGVGYCSGGSAARPGNEGVFNGGAGKPGIITIKAIF